MINPGLLWQKFTRYLLAVLFLTVTLTNSCAASPPYAIPRHKLPTLAERSIDQEDTLDISSRVFDSTLRLTASKGAGGAFVYLLFRNKQYLVNDRAGVISYGRSLQSAAAFDDLGECYNPTEAGGNYDLGKRKSSSKLISATVESNSISTESNMAFFTAPGQMPPGRSQKNGMPHCGERKDITSAQNTSILSGYHLKKKVAIGYMGLPNVIDYQVNFVIPRTHDKARFEAISMHLTPDFSEANILTYNEKKLVPTNQLGIMEDQPLILATRDHKHAVGIYSPMLPRSGRDYGHRAGGEVHVLRTVFWEENIKPGEYHYRCFLVIGDLGEVVNTMKVLMANLPYNSNFIRKKQ